MKKIRIGLIVVATILIIADLVILYYNNWTWSTNIVSAYLLLFVNFCTISSSILSIIYDKKKKSKITK